MRSFALLLCLLGASAASACGDDDASPDADVSPDADPTPDADETPDADLTPDAQPSMGVGKPCSSDLACGTGQACLDERLGFPDDGYCTVVGCAVDADCGGDAFCTPSLNADNVRLCLLRCLPGDTCSEPGHLCSSTLGGFLDVGQPVCMYGDASAEDGDACTGAHECNADSGCLSNPFSFPGGYCLTTGCTVGDDSTCAPVGDGTCIDTNGVAAGGTVCADRCTVPGDCRVAEGYVCVAIDAGRSACLYPAADAGDACTVPTDCGPAGSGWECLTDGFVGGYCSNLGCTADENTCPLDASCYDPDAVPTPDGDEYCAQECTTVSDCRMAEGYLCVPLGGASAVKVCVPGTT